MIAAIPDYDEVNKANIELFKSFGLSRMSSAKLYKCVLCGARASVDGSISDLGNNLICLACVHNQKLFPTGYDDAFKWCWSYPEAEKEEQSPDWRDSMLGLFLRRGGGRL